MPATKIDPRLRVKFKEVAREIMSRDRMARRLGRSQNTIGEIERALVQAFAEGQDVGKSSAPRPDHLGMDWEEVPPRGRAVLSRLTDRHDQFEVTNPIGLRRVASGQQERWRAECEGERPVAHTVAADSVQSAHFAGTARRFKNQ
ncbi:hypothetical protein [Sphingomonas sp. PB4P5]|uniref:hypothetical protein n=1 Tax=Parasphingomonas puruogangriensis TaxID=3096155 RepID=UPI002FC7627D